MYLGRFVEDGPSVVLKNSLYDTRGFHIGHEGFRSNPEYGHSRIAVSHIREKTVNGGYSVT